MSYECVRQRGLFDCGTACLTALLRYHGLAVSAKHPNFRIKGFGVSFIAGDNRWHYMRLSDEAYFQAITELKSG